MRFLTPLTNEELMQTFKSLSILCTAATTLAIAGQASAAIMVTNGDFESPNISAGDQIQDVPDWFDSTGDFTSWHRGESTDPQENGTQMLALGPGSGDAYAYQSLGTLDFDGGSLDWSLDQTRFADGNASAGLIVRFYAGNAVGADGTAIGTLGLTQIGSDAVIAAFGSDPAGTGSATQIGSVDLTGLTAGTQVWIELEGTGDGGFAPFDNVVVSQVPEPSSLALLGLGGLCMMKRRRRG